MNYKELYDDEKYQESFIKTLGSFQDTSAESLVYLIKNIITRDDFEIRDKERIKRLVFYYFYLQGKVEFDNGYSFFFNKDLLKLGIKDLSRIDIIELKDFKKYFEFGKNEIFLNKIVDNSIGQEFDPNDKRVKQANNIVDFFTYFLHQNFELYSLKGEYFPLFKWIINEIV